VKARKGVIVNRHVVFTFVVKKKFQITVPKHCSEVAYDYAEYEEADRKALAVLRSGKVDWDVDDLECVDEQIDYAEEAENEQ